MCSRPSRLTFAISALVALCSCAGGPGLKTERSKCPQVRAPATVTDPLSALDLVTNYTEAGCNREAIDLGTAIRKNYRDKDYSVTAEMFSLFVPEDILSEYVLESFERAYLSFVMASSYLRLGLKDEAAVELRRSYNEGRALIYNFGEDPVNALLAAALWDNLNQPETARPFWKKLSELAKVDGPAQKLARERLAEIDRGGSFGIHHWRIVGLGRFPSLDWSYASDEKSSSYWRLKPVGELPQECRSPSGAVLTTSSWVEKISRRYASDYHPFLHAKSWLRLPIGITYGLATFTAGLGVAVSGCAADAYASGNGALCKTSAQLGVGLMSNADVVTNYALRPDLRHWSRVPAGVLVTDRSDFKEEPCWRNQADVVRLVSFEFAR